MNEQIRVKIDDDEDSGHAAPARADKSAADPARAEQDRRINAERAHWQAQAIEAHRGTLEAQQAAALTEAQAGEIEYRSAFEIGDAAGAAAAQRKVARAEAKALRIDEARANIDAQRAAPVGDRFERFLAQHTAPTASWMREHREWVEDPQKSARLQSAHFDAMAEGLKPDTADYFNHVEAKIGLRDGGRANGHRNGARATADGVTVRMLQPGDDIPPGAVKMSRGAYEAATQTLTWGYNDPGGRFKKDDPIGVREYLRRQGIMKATPGWYDKPEGS